MHRTKKRLEYRSEIIGISEFVCFHRTTNIEGNLGSTVATNIEGNLGSTVAPIYEEGMDIPYPTYDEWLLGGSLRNYKGRRSVYEENVRKISVHNTDPLRTWTAGVNDYTALTSEEFEAIVRGLIFPYPSLGGFAEEYDSTSDVPVEKLPSSLDWRKRGVVTPVKNQGHCGSCWSFSAAESIESNVAINTGQLIVLSEQELIDCTQDPGDCGGIGGCHGATQELAFNLTITNGGIAAEASYPYAAINRTCPATLPPASATISGYVVLPPNNYTAAMNALATVGPLAISVSASTWHHYASGVLTADECNSTINHATQLVGYGYDNATQLNYWIVRNSWGTNWGEGGYIRLARYGGVGGGESPAQRMTPPSLAGSASIRIRAPSSSAARAASSPTRATLREGIGRVTSSPPRQHRVSPPR